MLTNKSRVFYPNKYQKRIILSRERLDFVIKLILKDNFVIFLTSQTGFKYSIDFFSAYQNFIPDEEKDKPWYANDFHLDKPNSKNMLKVFIPMSDISLRDGPLELLNITQTKQYLLKKINIKETERNYFIGVEGDIFLCKLNLCLHRASIPEEGKSTNLIMIQLNPSRCWYINANIYKRQYKLEPKFTSLSNIFINKSLLF